MTARRRRGGSPTVPPDDRVAVIVLLRQLRMTAAEIAETLAMPLSTVSVVLKRRGLGRLGRIGLEQPRRYERSRPGELVHVDVKKLGRIQGGAGKRILGGGNHYQPTFTDKDGHRRTTVGWEYVHIAIDDHSRLAYAEVLPDEKAATAIAFLERAVGFFARYGRRRRASGGSRASGVPARETRRRRRGRTVGRARRGSRRRRCPSCARRDRAGRS